MKFTIPGPMASDIPFTQFHAWQWARTVPRANVCIFKYLDSLGFVVGTDKLTESEFDILNSVLKAFHYAAPHIDTPMTFEECFTVSTLPGAFWVQGMPDRYWPRPAIVDALQGAGWIYDIKPDTTFFAVINGTLFAKYQQILGSRRLVELKG